MRHTYTNISSKRDLHISENAVATGMGNKNANQQKSLSYTHSNTVKRFMNSTIQTEKATPNQEIAPCKEWLHRAVPPW